MGRPHEPLGVAVRRGPGRDLDDLHVHRCEHRVERLGVSRVAVPDEEPEGASPLAEVHQQVAGLAAEFPDSVNARDVLSAIGSGERTFTNIARAAGGIAHASLTRAIDVLVAKRIVVGELPISTRPSKERRYRVTDPYLRFWLRFIGPHLPEIERLRGDLALQRIRDGWTAWRGRAVEPLARESLARLLPDGRLPAASAVGAYWNRSSTIEVDIVGADREPIAKDVYFLGSIKWLERSPFDSHDLAVLQKHRAALTDEPLALTAAGTWRSAPASTASATPTSPLCSLV
jgi:uncharacterized protein